MTYPRLKGFRTGNCVSNNELTSLAAALGGGSGGGAEPVIGVKRSL